MDEKHLLFLKVSAAVVTVVVVTCLFNDTVSPVWIMHILMTES